MNCVFRLVLLPLLIGFTWSGSTYASVIFKPGEKARYQSPGEEEMSGTARELDAQGQAMEKEGNIKGAIKAYRTLVRKHSHDTLAPGAAYRVAQLEEQISQYQRAAQAYIFLVEKFPKSDKFDAAIESLFRNGEMYLNGKKTKFLGITIKTSMDQAVAIFDGIARVAPYGKYAARAQFNLGRAREKQGSNELAIKAYEEVVEKFPNDPLAIDAQYQIGYIYSQASTSGTNDPNAAAKAKTGFQDFLYRYPHSEKAAQARENLKRIDHQQTASSFEIARFYDKQKFYRAAAIYYNDVIRQQPESVEGDKAKKRISELRAKLGDAALQSAALSAATANKKVKKMEPEKSGSTTSHAPMPQNSEPLPSADIDLSLPPPASLTPDTTTAPPSSLSDPLPTPEPSKPAETGDKPE
jgi:outer membrane protein assembly factor BamD